MSSLIAVPFQPHPAKLEAILDAVTAHRPWFPDELWHDPEVRRAAANRRIAEWLVNGHLWEVWRGDAFLGLIGIDRIAPRQDAYCHFIFVDRKLADKVELCHALMAYCFEHYDLHILRLEIPTYAKALAHFARRKLGFKHEAEDRDLSWPKGPRLTAKEAERGSRKFHATMYEGQWHDALLLSLLREEFACPVPASVEPTSTPHPSLDSLTPVSSSSTTS
jgi:RimJ/RimL family protein N-acetyltransferase